MATRDSWSYRLSAEIPEPSGCGSRTREPIIAWIVPPLAKEEGGLGHALVLAISLSARNSCYNVIGRTI